MKLLAGTSKGVFAIGESHEPATVLPERSVRDLARAGDRLLAGADTGIFASDDGGHTWQPSGIEGRTVWDILVRAGPRRRRLRGHAARRPLPERRRRADLEGDGDARAGAGRRAVVRPRHAAPGWPGAGPRRRPRRSQADLGGRRGGRRREHRRWRGDVARRSPRRQSGHPHDGGAPGEARGAVRDDGLRADRRRRRDDRGQCRRLPLRRRRRHLALCVAGRHAALRAAHVHRPAGAACPHRGERAHRVLELQGRGRRPRDALSHRGRGRDVALPLRPRALALRRELPRARPRPVGRRRRARRHRHGRGLARQRRRGVDAARRRACRPCCPSFRSRDGAAPHEVRSLLRASTAAPVGRGQRAAALPGRAVPGRAGRSARHRLRLGSRAPFPRGVLALLRARGLPRRRLPAHPAHPPGPRHRPDAAGLQPSRARRRAHRHARPRLERPGGLRHRASPPRAPSSRASASIRASAAPCGGRRWSRSPT